MDVSQYLEIFLDETKEHLQNLNTQILELEKDPGNMDTINEIFRAAHSLKGMAGTMGYKRMQALTHDMENVFSEVRTGNIIIKANLIDILFQCLDALEEYNNNIQSTADEGENDNAALIKRLTDVLNGEQDSESGPATTQKDEVVPVIAEALKMEFSEEQSNVLREALQSGKKLYRTDVYVSENCILKAARAFLVFKAVEDMGEILVSEPSTQDIEDENFENHFKLVIITDSPLDKLTAAIANVSEIEKVDAIELTKEDVIAKEDSQENSQDDSSQEDVIQTPPTAVVAAEKSVNVVKAAGAETSVNAAPATKAPERKQGTSKPVVNRTVRVDIEKLDVLMNLVSELIIAKNSLVSASTQEKTANNGFNEQIEYLESVTTNLHESVMKVRMVPIESVVNKFPRMIRDLTKKLNKQMELYMSGEETELDRTVVDEIGDPLMHLLRNAADHGLESTEVRIQRGKPAVGSIYLDAYQDGNNVIIEVRDDGNGIDVEVVKAKAIERGVVTLEQSANMSDKEIMDMLFLPSFSTSPKVTDVSGRGVGLDVVKSKIEALSGEVEVKSKLGLGSTWTIRLPLTLAIIQALMVTVGDEKYAISLGSIQTIEDINPSDIKFVQAKEVIHLRGTVIPLVRLSEVLDAQSKKSAEDNMIVVIVKKGDKLVGLVVDELMGQQEIVIKSLGRYINKCKIISGATILGDGEVALIVDANAAI